MTELNETNPKKKSGVLIGAIIALVVIIAVITYLILTKKTATAPTSNTSSTSSTNTTPGIGNLNATNTSNTNNTANTTNSANNTASNTTNTTSTTGTTVTPKTVEIDLTGTSFQFNKKEITVNQNDKVTIKFTSEGGEHKFVLDGYNLMTQTVATGESSSVSFTADRKGTFDFYCGVANHRDKGMEGKLIVQ